MTIDTIVRSDMMQHTALYVAHGFLRYETLKKLTPQQLSALMRSHIEGASLDAELDKLAITFAQQTPM